MKPLCIDLFCGMGGWAEGFLAEGYEVIGFDIERHRYPKIANAKADAIKRPGMSWSTDDPNYTCAAFNQTSHLKFTDEWMKYPGQLVLQDVLTLHGAQFKHAAAIVASPPCQKYSYMAMPWDRAKREIRWQQWERDSPMGDFRLNDLFNACFRIQREASEAAGKEIPMVVENVKGAQPWVGSARWHFGSFYLWGDVPALMPFAAGKKNSGGSWFGQRDGIALERNDPRDMRRNEAGEYVNASAVGGWNHPGKALDRAKNSGGSWFAIGSPGQKETGQNPVNGALALQPDGESGTKQGGNCWHDPDSMTRRHSSRSNARKAASAQIAKIPLPLAEHIARVFKP